MPKLQASNKVCDQSPALIVNSSVDQTSEELPASCLQSCECPKWLQWQVRGLAPVWTSPVWFGRTDVREPLPGAVRPVGVSGVLPPGGAHHQARALRGQGGGAQVGMLKYVVMEQVYLNQYYYTAFNKERKKDLIIRKSHLYREN